MRERESRFVKEARKNKGLSQSEMGACLGWVNAQFISNIERGISSLPLDKAKKFLKVTGASREEFIRARLADFKERLESL